MNESIILAVGIFAFVMAVTGVGLTVVEFKRTGIKSVRAPARDRPVASTQAASGHAH